MPNARLWQVIVKTSSFFSSEPVDQVLAFVDGILDPTLQLPNLLTLLASRASQLFGWLIGDHGSFFMEELLRPIIEHLEEILDVGIIRILHRLILLRLEAFILFQGHPLGQLLYQVLLKFLKH